MLHHDHEASNKDGGESIILMKCRILLDGGELEGDKLLMERHLCESHRPKRYPGIVKK